MDTTTQQFVLNDDTLIDTTRAIKTDLYKTVVYLHLFKKTQNMGGYIQIPYFMPSGSMRENATYITPEAVVRYQCKKLYIFKATHNIATDDPCDGEMVIELEPVTGNSNTLFMCFLLKNTRFSNNEPSALDKIIQMSANPPTNYTTIDFNMASFFDNDQKKIIYTSGVDTVVIYTTPISIQEIDFTTFSQIPTSLFSIYPVDSSYKILYNTSTTEGFQEGMDNVMTCTPINMDDPSESTKGAHTATYLMDNKIAKQEKQLSVTYSMFIFVIMLFCAYFGGPPIYKMLIIDQNKTSNDLILSTFLLLFLILLFGVILLFNGAIFDGTEAMVGMMFIIFTILSVVSVFNSRVADNDYRKPFGTNIAIDMNFADFSMGTAFADFFTKLGDHTLGKYFLPNTANMGIGFYWLLLMIILVIPCAVIGSKKDAHANKKERRKKGYRKNLIGLIMGLGSVYGLFALIFIFNMAYPAKTS